MIDDHYNELDDVDFTPSQEQIERAKPDIEFLKHCGLAHDLDDAWILQDLESYIMCIETLCNRVGWPMMRAKARPCMTWPRLTACLPSAFAKSKRQRLKKCVVS